MKYFRECKVIFLRYVFHAVSIGFASKGAFTMKMVLTVRTLQICIFNELNDCYSLCKCVSSFYENYLVPSVEQRREVLWKTSVRDA